MYHAEINGDRLKKSFTGYRTGKKWELVFGRGEDEFETEAEAIVAIDEFKAHSPEIEVRSSGAVAVDQYTGVFNDAADAAWRNAPHEPLATRLGGGNDDWIFHL